MLNNLLTVFIHIFRHDKEFQSTCLTPTEFRLFVIDSLDDNEYMIPFLQDPDRRTTDAVTPTIWKEAMRKDGQYNDDTLIQLTANWLKRDIVILVWNKNDGLLDPFANFATLLDPSLPFRFDPLKSFAIHSVLEETKMRSDGILLLKMRIQ